MDYIYKEYKGVSVYLYQNGLLELAIIKNGYRVKQSYSTMDYSINDALFMFKEYLKTI
jgi:hypothetical protein